MTDRLSRPNQPIATKWNLHPDVDFLQCTFVTVHNALRILLDCRELLSQSGYISNGKSYLRQHFQAAGFSEEVFRLAAAPRRTSTNHMYKDKWFRFAHWAVEQGIYSDWSHSHSDNHFSIFPL